MAAEEYYRPSKYVPYNRDTLDLLRQNQMTSLSQLDRQMELENRRSDALRGDIGEIGKNISSGIEKGQARKAEREKQDYTRKMDERKLASEEAVAKDQAALRQKQAEQYDIETASKRADIDFQNQEVAPGVTRRQRTYDLENQKVQADIASTKAKAATDALGPKSTANQYTAANFGKRLQAAESDFASLEASGFDRTTSGASAEAALPDSLNSLRSAASQQQRQAERNFLSAVLRRESGASISPTEYAEGEAKYFPRHGDKPEVLAQKKRAREMEIANMRTEAGAAWGSDVPAPTGGPVVTMPQPNAQDQIALDWAKANPSDKRAAEIMAKVGPKYGLRP